MTVNVRILIEHSLFSRKIRVVNIVVSDFHKTDCEQCFYSVMLCTCSSGSE